jgi:ribosome-binding ATPase YchF (GTP1/OBG family)
MPLDVGIVGPPGSGKTTLFTALTGVRPEGYGTPHVGVAQIADERLPRIAEVVGSAKQTPATIQLIDVPGTAAAQLGGVRRADALLAVVRDPDDLPSLELELLVADRDHVARRLERVRKEAKSGDPALRDQVQLLERLIAHIDAERPLRDWPGELPPELEPLTAKPLIPIVNGPAGADLALEAELRDLPPEEAAQFRDGGSSALEDVVRQLVSVLDLVTFFTAGDNEARAWTLRKGQTALEAAASIHTDIARGFIRCEVIRWDDLVESGSHAEAARRGLQRLEGKGYVVADGDVLNIRFNV